MNLTSFTTILNQAASGYQGGLMAVCAAKSANNEHAYFETFGLPCLPFFTELAEALGVPLKNIEAKYEEIAEGPDSQTLRSIHWEVKFYE